ncbi:4242_t:CDS:1 [Paraglomus occultum]|uniref:4242_t:CDS:1 n=1 Tax=Paraglomus occultum TaxID=144539 RepID=A0A9N8WNA9_9GLOM|nr:4242_t:CDS:1 [Paraglomus occultum]
MNKIDISEPRNTIEEIATNEHKLHQMERDFLKSLAALLLDNETKQARQIALLYSRLENNPLSPFFRDTKRIQNIVKYVCAESPTKERVRLDLEQLVAQHLSRDPNATAGNPLEVEDKSFVGNTRSGHPKKRPIRSVTDPFKTAKKPRPGKRANTVPTPVPPTPATPPPHGGTVLEFPNDVQNSDEPQFRFINYGQVSPSTTVDPQLLPPNHIEHPCPNNPSFELTTTETNTDGYNIVIDSLYAP